MSNNPQNNPMPNPVVPPRPTPTPRRIATLVGDWVRSAVVIIAWLVALGAALAGAFLALQAVMLVIALARRALGI